jgi:dTDP-4-amino-4,6-dideoxygalactose transaminase
MKKIKFLDLDKQQKKISKNLKNNINLVLKKSNYIMGAEVTELEQKLQSYTKSKFCITCASGTDALILALLSLNIGKGDYVVCPSFTFPATAESILITGATPIFVDVSKKTFNLCYAELKSILKKYKKNVKAIIAVDLFGLPANYKKLKAIAREFKIEIIADAAQSFGATYNNTKVGTLTNITCTSFFPAKPLGCYGDGGAIFTNNKLIKDNLVSLRAHGKAKTKYEIIQIGLNSRLDTMQAAILIAKMKIFDWELKERNKNALLYNKELENLYATPKMPKKTTSAWAQYTIRTKQRNKLKDFLNNKGIPTMIYYPIPMHLQPAYSKFKKNSQKFNNSIELANSVLSIPIHPYLKELEKEYIINNLKKATKLL